MFWPCHGEVKYRAQQSLYCQGPKGLWSSSPILTSALCYVLSLVYKCIFLGFLLAEFGSSKGQASLPLNIRSLLVSLLLGHPLLTRNQKPVLKNLLRGKLQEKNILYKISFDFLSSKCKVLRRIEWYLYSVIASMSRRLIAVNKSISKTLNRLVTPFLVLHSSTDMKCN